MPDASQRANGTGKFADVCRGLLNEFAARKPKRAGSLLITVYGDAIAPHGGTAWLGSLIRAAQPFGINHRLVRTSVFRLTREGWLTSEKVGRRSYYGLTELGRREVEAGSRRIYSVPPSDWSGIWGLVLLSGLEAAQRDEARRRLRWLGFASFTPNLMAHPSPDSAEVEARLESLVDADRLLMMESKFATRSEAQLRSLVHRAWALEELGARYRAFLDRFRLAFQAARNSGAIDPEMAFQVRTLMIHEYRKILLRDPKLPEALLPRDWDGVSAYQLCRNLYGLITPPAEEFLLTEMETADGPLRPADTQFSQRFGGLPGLPTHI